MKPSPIIPFQIDLDRCKTVFMGIMDTLQKQDARKGETVIALITMLGYQYKGERIPDAEMQQFVDDCLAWLSLRLTDVGGVTH